ncbi:hypothetical protein HD806DRAFT_502048 [Xylariaceae sp. AK1471]|nr:hypothetical protein HD806DRAFT_502048 [Xylariaceae sp. AK1471]
MPRLAPSLFRRAGKISPHLATLLPACRTIESAQNELRWIREHVLESFHFQSEQNGALSPSSSSSRLKPNTVESRVAHLVARRGSGEPLQYVLGTQPFGDLEILCEKGVLIPRPETEAWASVLADLVFPLPFHHHAKRNIEGEGEESLRILDLCSGTGCVGLSLYARGMDLTYGRGKAAAVYHRPPRVFGFDIETRAVRLARRNLLHNAARLSRHKYDYNSNYKEFEMAVTFRKADIFSDEWMGYLDVDVPSPSERTQHTSRKRKHTSTIISKDEEFTDSKQAQERKIDILVSNPPYISQRGFEVDTGRSVRNYEPKIALVPPSSSSSSSSSATAPCAPEDVFYARLLEIADTLRPRIAVFEVGDMAQAKRVLQMALARSIPQHSDPEPGPDKRYERRWEVVEIWRDWPDCLPSEDEEDMINVCGREVPVRGSGHGRVVFLAESRGYRLGSPGF